VTKIAITGYASLDHVAILNGAPEAGRTTTILRRPGDAWPRLGGSPAYVAAALVASGVPDAFPVCWVGEDAEGADYRMRLARGNIPEAGVAASAGLRTPMAVLGYEPDGGCICLYDPGSMEDLDFSEPQRGLLATSDWTCITIGPRLATETALTTASPRTRLAWVVKHDPRAMPISLAARIAERGDLIITSKAERAFLDEAMATATSLRPGLIVIETQGGSGALLRCDGKETFAGTPIIDVGDPTGAGDTFAGGVLAALVKGECNPAEILMAGHRAAAALLSSRRDAEKENSAQ
jgi:ribokinase